MEEKRPVTLLERVREAIRYRHYSLRTEQAYVEWIRRYFIYHNRHHPREMGAEEVRAFLGYLASERKVAAATLQQALSALLFLYCEVLGVALTWLGGRGVNSPADTLAGTPRGIPAFATAQVSV